ncbi:cytochrome P450 [Rhodococcus sp. (in: high G+C Gram-positive bacteria)]|uniref:cytochrome P450 n=1 Tax=Rhodococcus sp. TaxID=1831 RepID=UPI003B8A8D09
MTTTNFSSPTGTASDGARTDLPVVSGVRAIGAVTALGLPSVASGIIARRHLLMPLLEKSRADAMSIEMFRRLRTEFGRGPVEFRLPGRRVVLLLDPDDVARVLGDSPDPFTPANREKQAALGAFQPHGVLISKGEVRTRRRAVNEAALETPKPLHSASDVIARTIDREIAAFAQGARDSGTFDAADFIRTWWKIARQVTLGESSRDDTDVTDRLWKLRANGNWSYLTPPRRRLRDRFFDNLYDYADRAEPGSLIHALGSAELTPDVDPVGQIPHWLFAFDAAGMATLRALALLAGHPDELSRVREEASDRAPGAASTLPIHRATILESLRLWPTTPAILRDSTRPTTWRVPGGARAVVPEGSLFLVLTPPLHRDRDRFDFADTFTPDIWIDGRADDLKTLLPFSGGPVECPGRNVSLLVASTVLSALLQSFERIEQVSEPRLRAGTELPPTLNHYGLKFAAS